MSGYCNASYNYQEVRNFGDMEPSSVNNPVSYCINDTIDPYFLHGNPNLLHGGQNCPQCQWFMSSYCAQGWDNFCELAAQNTQTRFPNQMDFNLPNPPVGLTAGEMLLRNTAMRKYLTKMLFAKMIWEPFDPRVPDSPLISKWILDEEKYPTQNLRPVFEVDPKTIDEDPVMNRILFKYIYEGKQNIAEDILLGIYKTMNSNGKLNELDNTKLGNFYKKYFYKFK